MKTKTSNKKPNRRINKRKDFPESQVGFPERNDVSNPNEDMERVHVDMDTLDISRKNADELAKEVVEKKSSKKKME